MGPKPFSVEERNRVQERVIAMGRADGRILACAAVGSTAHGRGDRWSDLDLTFGVLETASLSQVLEDFSRFMERALDAVPLFDVGRQSSVYRVFLLPGNLQVDLSFTPGHAARYGPNFRLLFGDRVRESETSKRGADEIFGYAVHHAVRARYSLERGRPWQAEYWIDALRDEALALACHHRALETAYGRGLDRLPSDVLRLADAARVRSLEGDEPLRALRDSVELLLREASQAEPRAGRLAPGLRALGSPDWT